LWFCMSRQQDAGCNAKIEEVFTLNITDDDLQKGEVCK
jgi:hypothetical protein